MPVHKIPFPTITICPEIKMERNVFDYTNVSRQLWEEYKQNGNISDLDDEELSISAYTFYS